MGDAAGLVETAKPSLAVRQASLLGRASQLVEVERLIARQRDELFHDGVVALTHAFYVIWLRFTFGLWISVRDVLAVEQRKRKASPVGGSSSRLDADDDAGFEAALCTMPIPCCSTPTLPHLLVRSLRSPWEEVSPPASDGDWLYAGADWQPALVALRAHRVTMSGVRRR